MTLNSAPPVISNENNVKQNVQIQTDVTSRDEQTVYTPTIHSKMHSGPHVNP